jgi:hypothetical protein
VLKNLLPMPMLRRAPLWSRWLILAALLVGCPASESADSADTADAAHTPPQKSDLAQKSEKLAALGYLAARPIAPEDRHKVGVERIAPQVDDDALHLLTEKRRIRLIETDGDVVREATADELDVGFFSEAHYAPDGTLLVIDTDESLLWLDEEWELRREVALPAHHDIEPRGEEIYVVTRRLEYVHHGDGALPLLVDHVTALSKRGEVLQEISIHQIAGRFLSEAAVSRARRWVARNGDPILQGRTREEKQGGGSAFADTPLDVYHTNYVHVADRDVPGVCRRGDLLISIRNLDIIAFVRPEEKRIVWLWGPGELEGQHNPVLLPDGNVLVFDNGRRRRWSRVVELDPRTNEIVWEYRGDPKESFFSGCCGAVQKLPNGNVVITDAGAGRVFEVTPDKEIVWDYWNAYRSEAKEKRISVLRSHRLPGELAEEIPR